MHRIIRDGPRSWGTAAVSLLLVATGGVAASATTSAAAVTDRQPSSSPARTAASPSLLPAATLATRISGWPEGTVVRPWRSVLRLRVVVSGPVGRAVLLQRRSGTSWVTAVRTSTRTGGVATVAVTVWAAPQRYRLLVPRAGSYRAASTPWLTVRSSPPPFETPPPIPAPPPSGSTPPPTGLPTPTLPPGPATTAPPTPDVTLTLPPPITAPPVG